jgi:hypothetical protein
MNRTTRIFLYGIVIVGLSIVFLQSVDVVIGIGLALVGLVISGQAAFRDDEAS